MNTKRALEIYSDWSKGDPKHDVVTVMGAMDYLLEAYKKIHNKDTEKGMGGRNPKDPSTSPKIIK